MVILNKPLSPYKRSTSIYVTPYIIYTYIHLTPPLSTYPSLEWRGEQFPETHMARKWPSRSWIPRTAAGWAPSPSWLSQSCSLHDWWTGLPPQGQPACTEWTGDSPGGGKEHNREGCACMEIILCVCCVLQMWILFAYSWIGMRNIFPLYSMDTHTYIA